MIPGPVHITIAKDGVELVRLRDFTLRAGCITFLFGESGIGKSLVARALFGLLDPDEFTITIDGLSYRTYLAQGIPARLRQDGFFVFQEPSSHLNPLLTLRQQITEGDLAAAPTGPDVLGSLWSGPAREELDRLLEVYPKPHRPSGGEKQRVLCAMAFLKMDIPAAIPDEQRLFVFDEPTGSLDNRYRDVVLEMLFERFRRRPATVLLITHDYSMISVVMRRFADLLPRVDFSELTLEAGGLSARPFSPGTYTSWLSDQKKTRADTLPVGTGQPAMRIESGAEIFGRRLVITREGSEREGLELPAGGMVYLKAPSGTGKTTIAKMLMGLVRGERFRASVGDQSLSERTQESVWRSRLWGRRITMVFQHADEALNLRSSVRGTFHGLPVPLGAEAIEKEVKRFFGENVDRSFFSRRVAALSGGQKQRLNLLRGLLLRTDVVILDEPLNGLDFVSMQRVLGLIRAQMGAGTAFLLISHNEEIFESLVPADRVYHLSSSAVS